MDYKNIGISFKGNYLVQGTYEEKCKLAKKLNVSNIELEIRKLDQDINLKKILDIYNKNIIFNLPIISYNLNNLKEIENLLLKISSYKVDTFIFKAYNLNENEYEWSTEEEKRIHLENMAKGLASLASNKVTILVENHTYRKDDGYFGQNVNQISDLLVFSRKILTQEYGFSDIEANKYIKLCLNVDNVVQNSSMNELTKWIELFRDSIGAVKIKDSDNYEVLCNEVFEKFLQYNIVCPVLFGVKVELEEINSRLMTFVNIINIFNQSKSIKVKQEITVKDKSEAGYTNIVIVSMIVLTILIGILMVYVRFNS